MAAKVEYNENLCNFLKEMNASHYQIPPDMAVESCPKPFCDIGATTRKIGPHSLVQYAVNFGLCEATASEMCSVAFESTANGNISNNALNVNASSYVSDASSWNGGTDGLCEASAWEMSREAADIILQYVGHADDRDTFSNKVSYVRENITFYAQNIYILPYNVYMT